MKQAFVAGLTFFGLVIGMGPVFYFRSTNSWPVGADGLSANWPYALVVLGLVMFIYAKVVHAMPTVALAVLSGDGQSAQVGVDFAAPVVIEVRDQAGSPLSGIEVTLVGPASGAGVRFPVGPAGGPMKLVDSTFRLTDPEGKVSVLGAANDVEGGPYAVTIVASAPTSVLVGGLLGKATSSCQFTNLAPANG